MLKAIVSEIKGDLKPSKLIASFVVIVFVLWVLALMKKNRIASQLNPLEA